MVQYFCPACFAKVPFGLPTCPECAIDAEQWQRGLTYTERLVHALGHPLASTRMMAIIGLTGRAEPDTAVPLALCALAFPVDVVQGREIVRALTAMPDCPQRTAGLRMLGEHPSRIVRNAALALLPGAVAPNQNEGDA